MEQVFLSNEKLEMNMQQIFKTKCAVNLGKYKVGKIFRLGGVKWQKQIKFKKLKSC